MKKLIIVFMIFFSVLSAQDDINVMSYYASDNSLDGQPLIDKVNILKFYPVFAIQDSIKSVNVTIYYGNKTYENYADKMNGGKYWQTLLPEFKLGDAIQRVEVETEFSVPKRLLEKWYIFQEELINIIKRKNLVIEKNKMIIERIRKPAEIMSGIQFGILVNVINKSFKDISLLAQEDSSNIINNIEITLKYENILDSTANDTTLLPKFISLVRDKIKFNKILDYVAIRNNTADELLRINENYRDLGQSVAIYKDTLRSNIFNEIIGEFADTSFSGPAIRKSDLIIEDDFKSARLLYRYYKNNLRYRKVLDPAESLGIFRARYIPLPVVGTPRDNKVQLLRPMEANVPVVFEVGLAFGDEVVSGDNTFEPAFSLSRLGVAIVITEKLFKADAEILGIAFTYDFNSYASIGFGRNLAQGQSYPYFSFGINKKAFEQLLVGLAGLFN